MATSDASAYSRRCLTLSILNCAIGLHGSVYPPEPIRSCSLDARVSAALQKAPASVGTNIRRDVARYLAIAREAAFSTREAHRITSIQTSKAPEHRAQ